MTISLNAFENNKCKKKECLVKILKQMFDIFPQEWTIYLILKWPCSVVTVLGYVLQSRLTSAWISNATNVKDG